MTSISSPRPGASSATPQRAVCDGFAWAGQSLLCCDDCGWPWFLHPGNRHYPRLFSGEWEPKPFTEHEQAQIPAMVAAWEANALWQREGPVYRTKWNGTEGYYDPPLERQVGKDFPYPTGPTRPVPAT